MIPRSLRHETLQKIHSGHQGIQRCRLRVSTSVWWHGISQQVEQVIKSCPECAKASVPHVQPMIASPLPSHPWEKVASDLFQLNGKTYLLVADRQVPGRVVQPANTPRSYMVETPSGLVRRNLSHLSPRPGEGPPATVPTEPQQRTIATPSRTGTYVGPPSRLTYWKRGDVAYL